MKIFIVTDTQYPNGMSATRRIQCYARITSQIGFDCEVLIYHRTEIYGHKAINIDKEGKKFGVPYKYIGSTPLRSKYPLVRKVYDWYDKKQLIEYLSNNIQKNDIILLYVGRDVDYTIKIINLAHKHKAFVTRDLCEFPYGTGKETIKTIKNRIKIFNKQLPLLDGVIAISSTLANLAKAYGNDKCVVDQIPILVDFEEFELADKSEFTETPYIFHSGTLYEQKDGILGMIEAFGLALQNSKININLISTGTLEKSPHANEIKSLTQKYNLEDKLIFTGYINDDELKNYLSKASLVIINKYKTQQNWYCFSTKLGEYLAASKPVITTNVGESTNFLHDQNNAYVVEPNDPIALSKAIIHAFKEHEERKRIGINGKILCKEKFDFRKNDKILAQHFKRIQNQSQN